MPIAVTSLSPVLGAEVHGVDLSQAIDDDTWARIHTAFLDHGVLFFRQQPELTPEAHTSFARRFGPLHTHPAAPAEADGAIFVIHTHRDSPIANGNGWHTDVSCDERPPMATMLQMHTLPDRGGDTLFADAEAAYATLPAELRDRLLSLDAVHESEHVYRGRYRDRGGSEPANTVYPESVHPVVRRHPDTGRAGLYVNPSFTTSIVGLAPDESAALLDQLFAHQQKPEFQIRFTWQANDVALWDNRRLLHFAVWDYWPHERRGHRVSILGDQPQRAAAEAPHADVGALRISIGRLA